MNSSNYKIENIICLLYIHLKSFSSQKLISPCVDFLLEKIQNLKLGTLFVLDIMIVFIKTDFNLIQTS